MVLALPWVGLEDPLLSDAFSWTLLERGSRTSVRGLLVKGNITAPTLYVRTIFVGIEPDVLLLSVYVDVILISIPFALLWLRLESFIDLEFGNKETIHVVHVWIESSCEADPGVECLPPIFSISRFAEFKTGFDEFDIGPFAKGVIHYGFVFVYGDGARRVY